MNILFYTFSLLYYVSYFVSNGRSHYYPGSGCPRCKGVDFQIKYISSSFCKILIVDPVLFMFKWISANSILYRRHNTTMQFRNCKYAPRGLITALLVNTAFCVTRFRLYSS